MRADLALTTLALTTRSKLQMRAAAAAFTASSASPLKGDASANRNRKHAAGAAFSARLAAAADPRSSKASETSVSFRPDASTRATMTGAKQAPAVSDEEKLLREVEASLKRTRLASSPAGSAADAARRAAAAAANVAEGMSRGVRSAGTSPAAATQRRWRAGKTLSPVAVAAKKAAASSPDSCATSRSGASANESVSVRSHGIETPDGQEATSEKGGMAVEKDDHAGSSPGIKSVSRWMDAVVERAKAARAATGASTETLAAATPSACGESRVSSSPSPPAPTTREETADGPDATRAPVALAADAAKSAPPSDARGVLPGKAAGRERRAYARPRLPARDDAASLLAKARKREETFEDELRKATERCAEIEAGRRSARAALAEMASQNARLVSAFSAKKEEARTLRGKLEEARRAEASAASGAEEAARAARVQTQTLREALERNAEEHAVTRAALAEAKVEIERLRAAATAAARREARGEGDAESAGARAREESLAARVARKELEMERAEFAAERVRWESERIRWAGEVASVRVAAAAAATAKGGGAFQAEASSKPHGVPPNAAFKDPYKASGTRSRSQPSSPPRRPKGTALSPARAANSFSSARGEPGASEATRGARPASSSPTGAAERQTRAPRPSSVARSPGPDASPRRRAEHHKIRGNNEFHAKRYAAALEQYTAGLNIDSFEDDAFRAILHANRAAAYQAMRRFCDAVMDCCVSHHLDPTYLRALQRRADACLSMGDWPGAARDLATLAPSMGPECSAKLAEARRKVQKGSGVDHYAVLGLNAAATAAEIKQAYRKLALRLHPDKAPAAPPLRAAAEALFKHVAQAYATLSDAAARRKYDASSLATSRGGKHA